METKDKKNPYDSMFNAPLSLDSKEEQGKEGKLSVNSQNSTPSNTKHKSKTGTPDKTGTPKKTSKKKTQSKKNKKDKALTLVHKTYKLPSDCVKGIENVAYWQRRKIQDVVAECISMYLQTIPPEDKKSIPNK